MYRWGIAVAGVLVFLLVTSQLLIPNFAAREVEDRLTAGGGSAEVTMGAVPAVRLLFGDGERIEVTARELELDLDRDAKVWERLDGFGNVDIAIESFRAGPFELDHFELRRESKDPYRLVSSGRTSMGALVDYGIERFNLPGGPLADLATDLFGDGLDFPVELDMTLRSKDGGVEVIDGDTTIAGLPAGPLAEMISASIIAQL